MLKFSIIIPCFNGAKYLDYALQSLVEQSYKNFEVIFVDDGSIDNSKSIFQNYSSIFPSKYIYQTNQGNGKATYVGIETSEGNYITFLDADDMYLPERLTIFNKYILENNFPDVIYSDSLIIDGYGNIKGKRSEQLHKPLLEGDVFSYYVKSSLLQSTMVAYKKESLLSFYEILKSVNIKYANDYALGLSASLLFKFICIPVSLSLYRMHNNSYSFKFSDYLKLKERVLIQKYLLKSNKLTKKNKILLCKQLLKNRIRLLKTMIKYSLKNIL